MKQTQKNSAGANWDVANVQTFNIQRFVVNETMKEFSCNKRKSTGQ